MILQKIASTTILRTLAISGLVGAAALCSADQLADNFDNPAYEGSYNNVIWAQTGGAGSSAVQASGKMALNIQPNDWDYCGLASNNLVGLQSADIKKGTAVTVVVDPAVLSGGGDFRGGMYCEGQVSINLVDAGGGSGGGMWPTTHAIFCALVYFSSANPDKLCVEFYSKTKNQASSNGKQCGYRAIGPELVTINSTGAQVTLTLVANQKYWELLVNGKRALAGQTVMLAEDFPGYQAGVEVLASNVNTGRTAMKLDSITVGDAGLTPFTASFENMTDDFAANQVNAEKLIRVEGYGSANISCAGGQATIQTDTNSAWALVGLQSAVSFPCDSQTSYVISVDRVAVNKISQNPINTVFTVLEFPGGFNKADSPGFYFSYGGGIQANVKDYGTGWAGLWASYKTSNMEGSNGTEIPGLTDQWVGTGPVAFEFEVSQTAFVLRADGVVIASGSHAAGFGDRWVGLIAASNQDVAEGSIVIDNLSFKKIPETPSRVADYNLY